jgi:hypothetical protein
VPDQPDGLFGALSEEKFPFLKPVSGISEPRTGRKPLVLNQAG